MVYTTEYASPLGPITLACDGEAIIGLWFNGQRYFGNILPEQTEKKEHPLFADAKRWLEVYFSGREPDFLPLLRYDSTPFRRLICEIMLTIPYGKTMTYGQIAAEAAKRLGAEKMSAQAVGGAVGHNEISIIIPCHRVVGTTGSLTGYAGGIDKKGKLLERAESEFHYLEGDRRSDALVSTAFLYGRRQNIVLPLADVLWVYRHDLKLLWAKSTVVELLTYDGRSITLRLERGGSRRTADASVQAVSARNPEALVGLNRENQRLYSQQVPHAKRKRVWATAAGIGGGVLGYVIARVLIRLLLS